MNIEKKIYEEDGLDEESLTEIMFEGLRNPKTYSCVENFDPEFQKPYYKMAYAYCAAPSIGQDILKKKSFIHRIIDLIKSIWQKKRNFL